MYDLYAEDFVPVAECAQRLGMSEQTIRKLVSARILKAKWDGPLLVVQPALIAGITTGPGACG
ncbi:hypothetical protein HZU40_09675 [Mycolicibacterium fluoranthenivorans]|uniref:Helix-turn-helix domain-containing protein n=1 Tax=Mycolicibacterium fluoranthenivorans TaxID=258505 RepID=A0A7G8PB09_9MYCO|nr:hypothetical protein [Mycolicibacterium fluoranthenivorans]QNJ91525.1 hypothetical protein HZU40_25545 [Mycolicibacterium fluoranthenivorans]QNJ94501.1 hypothetical protein HZU40_09675 [Mycolicibacterium fluoranthenivorans]